MSLPSSSSSISRKRYDVFLSFRGEDTRTNFTDHLYHALKRSGIVAFRDDPKLEAGEEIGPELFEAIQQSWCSVIVFSKNYAFSGWCLKELAEIVKQRKERGLKVFPIFYDVNPSDLRRQNGKVKKAFAKHTKRYKKYKDEVLKRRNAHIVKQRKEPAEIVKEKELAEIVKEKNPSNLRSRKRKVDEAFAEHEERKKEDDDEVQKWRNALSEVAGIKGWHLENRHEYEFIGKIVKEISDELCKTYPIVYDDELFGISSRVRELNSKIKMGGDDVRIVGICGMCGIGKTTLARVVYNLTSPYFEAKSFIANVREASDERQLVSLQKQLLSETLFGESFNFFDVYEGNAVISNRLSCKKVLVVLDDVDNLQHLKCLVGRREWFGSGSRIIVTTRHEHLLRSHRVDDMYRPSTLNNNDAHRLFNSKAFGGDRMPEGDFIELSKLVVGYAGGLPLALKILGSNLCGRDAAQWRSAIEWLDVLAKKYLVTVDEYNRLRMHDLLKEMGRKIVRDKSINEPGKRCRLWEERDVYHVLTKNTATETIEGMIINNRSYLSESNKMFNLSADAFSKMKKLRFLKVFYFPNYDSLNYLSNELRLLDWKGCPLRSLPSSFQPHNLVALLLPYSHIEQLRKGTVVRIHSCPTSLEILDLSGNNFISIPSSFTQLSNIKVFANSRKKFDIILPGSEIPEWFRMPLNIRNDNQWMGVALCCIFVNHDASRDENIFIQVAINNRCVTMFGFMFPKRYNQPIIKDRLIIHYFPRDKLYPYSLKDKCGENEIDNFSTSNCSNQEWDELELSFGNGVDNFVEVKQCEERYNNQGPAEFKESPISNASLAKRKCKPEPLLKRIVKFLGLVLYHYCNRCCI